MVACGNEWWASIVKLSLQQERSFPSFNDNTTQYLWTSRLFYHDGTVHITSTFKNTISRCELPWAIFDKTPGQCLETG
jgi:hypothetical protein